MFHVYRATKKSIMGKQLLGLSLHSLLFGLYEITFHELSQRIWDRVRRESQAYQIIYTFVSKVHLHYCWIL